MSRALLPPMIFVVLASYQLNLPGLHNDEAQEAGLPALQMLDGRQVTAFRNVGLGTLQYPLMVQDYIGAINVYLVAPFVKILGHSVASVRILSILIGAATVLITFGFVSAVWGKRAAFIAACFLSVNPSFVFWNRQGILIASITLTLTVALMWVGFRWATGGGRRWALLLGFLAGFGVYSKLLFVWIILGLAGTVMLFNMPLIWQRALEPWPRRPTIQDVASALIGLLVGLSPLIVFNLSSGGTLISGAVAMIGNDYDVLASMAARLDHFRAVLGGRDHLWYLGGSATNGLWEWALIISVLVILVRSAAGCGGSRRSLALMVTLLIGLLQVPFTPTAAGAFPHHFAVFAPMWVTLVAVVSDCGFTNPFLLIKGNLEGKGGYISQTIRAFRLQDPSLRSFLVALQKTVLGLGLLVMAVRDVQLDIFYHSVLRESGGEGQYSDAIYHLVDELDASLASSVVALDWGFAPQLRYLTGERIIAHEVFGYTQDVDQGFSSRVEPFLDLPGTVFVAHWPNETFFPRREEFEEVAANNGFNVERLQIVARRNGAPMFELMAATPN